MRTCDVIRYFVSERPVQASFEITRRCNSRCRSCNYWRKLASPSKELQIEEIKEIFTDLYEFGIRYIFLSGGEPLLRGDIVEVTRMLSEIGFSIELVTNGVLLNRDRISNLLKIKNIRIVVSLDSLKPEVYANIRGVNEFSTVLSNIQILAEISARKKIPARLNMTVNSLNYNEIDPMINLCRSLKLFLSAYPYNSAERGKFMSSDDVLDINKKREDVSKVFELLSRKCVREKYIFGFSFVYERIADFVRGNYVEPCGAGIDHMVIDPEGNVSICEEFSPFGSLRKNKIREIFNPEIWSDEVMSCYTQSPCFLGCSRVLTILKKYPFRALTELLTSGKLLNYLFYLDILKSS